jgi:thioredoxin 1
MSESVFEFSDSNFETEVLKADKPVLVDFWAEWCGPCRVIGPTVAEIAKEYAGKVKVGKVNVDHNQNIAMKYGIRSIPALLIFKGGAISDQIVGAVPKARITELLDKVI